MNLEKWTIVRDIFAIKREEWLDRDSLEALQERRLTRVVRAARDTPHYGRILPPDISDLDSLARLAPTSKEDVRRDPFSFVRKQAAGRLQVFNTSGSTGKPMPVYMDQGAIFYSGAVKYAMVTDFGLSPLDHLAEVSIWTKTARPGRMGIFRRLQLPVSDSEEANLGRMATHHVNVFSAYPTIAQLLAGLNSERRTPLRMKSVYCGGEVLRSRTRESIESSFSAEVFQRYGNTEFGFVAWECPQEHRLHVCSSSVILEILDAKGKPRKSGEGEVALTTLHNLAMPLIRFRIGDLASWGKECPCGRGWPVLGSIAGRSGETVRLPSGRIRPTFAFNVLYDSEFRFDGISQFQIVQESPEVFVFRYIPSDGGPTREVLSEIEKRIRRACLGEDIEVGFQETDSISKSPSGKTTHMIPYRG
ncbi:MAG: AMP-binding protein [Candidatus Micrarchaeia archaeon]